LKKKLKNKVYGDIAKMQEGCSPANHDDLPMIVHYANVPVPKDEKRKKRSLRRKIKKGYMLKSNTHGKDESDRRPGRTNESMITFCFCKTVLPSATIVIAALVNIR
jgi:hypothetical protein